MTTPADEAARAQKAEAARTRMAELAAKFVNRSNGDLATMRAAVKSLQAGDAGGLGEIQHLAHRMVGTGATLGFERLADRARDLERLAEKQAPGDGPDAAGLERFDAALRALGEELGAVANRAAD